MLADMKKPIAFTNPITYRELSQLVGKNWLISYNKQGGPKYSIIRKLFIWLTEDREYLSVY